MILQSLYHLYQRRMADPDPQKRLPVFGFEEKPMPWIIDIDRDGKLVNLRSTLSEGKKPQAKSFLVPQGVKKTSGVAANLLWDTLEYVLGVDTRGKPARVVEQHAAFRARLRALPAGAQSDEGLIAIERFYAQWQPEQLAALPEAAKLLEANPNMTFQLVDDPLPICLRPAVAAACIPEQASDVPNSMCLITGQDAPLEVLHTSIKGVWGAQTAGANIVSFNADAYCSFGKNGQQGANSPVSQQAAFGYTTALNALLSRNSTQRTQVGDASTVFWAAQEHELEEVFPDLFGEPKKDDPSSGTAAVKKVFDWAASGKPASLDGQTPFFVLGLAPNAARIAIRFWHELPVRDLARRTLDHFACLDLPHASFEPDYPSVFRLLANCAAQGKADNIPPGLAGDVMRAIIEGTPYPATLYQAALNRCRIEQNVNYYRAALLKACLLRQWYPTEQSRQLLKKDFFTMTENQTADPAGVKHPDPDHPDNQPPAYWMGQLFAVLERLQQYAIDPNSSIRDRYFGAAMSSPAMVFNTLMRLHHHHLSKLGKSAANKGTAVFLDKRIGEIMQKIDGFPNQLTPQQQGLFAIGYYHQRHEFFTKKTAAESTGPATETKETK